jgi:hypothetical protein
VELLDDINASSGKYVTILIPQKKIPMKLLKSYLFESEKKQSDYFKFAVTHYTAEEHQWLIRTILKGIDQLSNDFLFGRTSYST